MKSGVVYLDVPYQEKDIAKKRGAKWDGEEKKWYVPQGIDINNFVEWIDEEPSAMNS